MVGMPRDQDIICDCSWERGSRARVALMPPLHLPDWGPSSTNKLEHNLPFSIIAYPAHPRQAALQKRCKRYIFYCSARNSRPVPNRNPLLRLPIGIPRHSLTHYHPEHHQFNRHSLHYSTTSSEMGSPLPNLVCLPLSSFS